MPALAGFAFADAPGLTASITQHVAEVIQQLSTEVIFSFILRVYFHFLVSTTFALDLIIILLIVLVNHYLQRHILLRQMGKQVGAEPPYSKRERDVFLAVFQRGFQPSDRVDTPDLKAIVRDAADVVDQSLDSRQQAFGDD